ANRGDGHQGKRSQFTKAQSSVEWDASRVARCHDLDSPDRMKLRPVGKSLDKRSSQSAISIALRYINMKMCRVVLANILNVPKIRNIIEMSKFCWIFEAACEISDAPGVIKSNKEAVSMFCNISSERDRLPLCACGSRTPAGKRSQRCPSESPRPGRQAGHAAPLWLASDHADAVDVT